MMANVLQGRVEIFFLQLNEISTIDMARFQDVREI